MKDIEFFNYSKIIFSILKRTHNQELSTKLFKVLVITGSIQNILIAANIPKDKYKFSKCSTTLSDNGFRVSINLKQMFRLRNKIAHINDLISIMEIFNTISMVDIDKEFEVVIKVIALWNPKEFGMLENNSENAVDNMNIF